jgi:hypothetical protein
MTIFFNHFIGNFGRVIKAILFVQSIPTKVGRVIGSNPIAPTTKSRFSKGGFFLSDLGMLAQLV